MEEKIVEKTCGNCIYYYQHYGAFNSGFKKIDFGHCINTMEEIEVKFGMDKLAACGDWESNEQWQANKRAAAKKKLLNVIKSMEQLAEYFEEE